MGKRFNITGTCIPEKHYMADISEKLDRIFAMVEEEKYFTINRPRQYGKTTTLFLLEKKLTAADYLVIRISFEGIGDERFQSEAGFIESLLRLFRKCLRIGHEDKLKDLIDHAHSMNTLDLFSDFISDFIICSQRRVVLIIDEVDKSSNNQLFLSFLGMLRAKYLLRNEGRDETFQSVILAGVHDVKALKLKLRPDDERKYNSPWNIAVEFEVDLSLNVREIGTMLEDYVNSRKVAMDIGAIAERLFFYTSGYPFLVSRLCEIIDTKILPGKIPLSWRISDVDEAFRLILTESNPNFEVMVKNLENNSELYDLAQRITLDGENISFVKTDPIVSQGVMYGIFAGKDGYCVIHNRIYASLIYEHMTMKTIRQAKSLSGYNFRGNFITGNRLEMEKVLLKFQQFMLEQYNKKDAGFLEREGRLLFLAFIKPIINGCGFDLKEVQISEEKRLDVVITFLQERYIVELKIWRGQQAHLAGIEQLADYMKRLNMDQGYLVIYDLRKTGREDGKRENIIVDGREIFMVWV